MGDIKLYYKYIQTCQWKIGNIANQLLKLWIDSWMTKLCKIYSMVYPRFFFNTSVRQLRMW